MRPAPRAELAWQLQQEGKSYSEIAAQLGTARGTIGVLIRLAKARRGLATNPWSDREESETDAELAAVDSTPGCARCGLRGEHVCLSFGRGDLSAPSALALVIG